MDPFRNMVLDEAHDGVRRGTRRILSKKSTKPLGSAVSPCLSHLLLGLRLRNRIHIVQQRQCRHQRADLRSELRRTYYGLCAICLCIVDSPTNQEWRCASTEPREFHQQVPLTASLAKTTNSKSSNIKSKVRRRATSKYGLELVEFEMMSRNGLWSLRNGSSADTSLRVSNTCRLDCR